MTRAARDPAWLATAIEAVVRAGDTQLAGQRGRLRPLRIDKKSRIDIVTEVDLRVETEFRAMVAARFPTHRVLAEELGSDEPAGGAGVQPAGHRWLFDPIDGTTNYAHGLPTFCASVALEIDGRVELGAVYDPSRRELFTAERGGGARLNGVPLRVSTAAALVDALLVTGFPYDVHERTDDLVGLFARFLGRARAVRRLGSAALDLCYVAAGRLDGFWEPDLQPWDVAAGFLVLEESGGTVTRFDGGPFSPYGRELVASNGHLHEQMLDVIQSGRSGQSGQAGPATRAGS